MTRRSPKGAPARRWRSALGLARVRGRSMHPTLRDGDLLVTRVASRARPGQLVLVDLPGGRPRSVKRVVHAEPAGWWVERDNPREGADSWSLGAVAPENLVAVVLLRLWPRPRVLLIPRRRRPTNRR